MKISHTASPASVQMLRFAEALIAYVPGIAELKHLCRASWPSCDNYKGHTHWRVKVEGQAMHHFYRPSFYEDFTVNHG